jgi:hypothetical protein
MTKKQAYRAFIDGIPLDFPTTDRPAFREAWCQWIDGFARRGWITGKQAQTWEGPPRYTEKMRAARIRRDFQRHLASIKNL